MRYDCRYGLPHDTMILGEDASVKVERCKLCRKVFRWKKFNGRVNNVEYLKVHARNFAQHDGRTKQLYMKLYHHDQTKLTISPR